MPSNNIYTPEVGGSVQTTYYNQMGTALPGNLAFGTDINLSDSAIVETDSRDGILVGAVVSLLPIASTIRAGINQYKVVSYVPGQGEIAIMIRNRQGSSNSSGKACAFNGELVNVLRSSRVGGRIWVSLGDPSENVALDATVYVTPTGAITAVTAGNAAIPGAKFKSDNEESTGLVIVEMGGR